MKVLEKAIPGVLQRVNNSSDNKKQDEKQVSIAARSYKLSTIGGSRIFFTLIRRCLHNVLV